VPVNSFAVRFALVVLALVAGAWLVVGVRAIRLEDDANAILDRAQAGPIPQEEVDAALDDLDKARRLSADQGPRISEGQLLLAAGHSGSARAVAGQVTKDEPDNLQGWYLTWLAANPNTPAKRRAQKRVLELNPWFEYVLLKQRHELLRQQQGR
jgi:hypothetical protein